jgi:hypothetical protein
MVKKSVFEARLVEILMMRIGMIDPGENKIP